MQLIERIKKIIESLNTDLHEREEIVAVTLLAAISGQNIFLLGPPGTAKSLISRRISCAFKNSHYYEYLMNRFSTPEEVFGPVSIKALKEDTYTRKTTGYLPTSDFAFLDEIWKSSPGILNALLTIVNERIFRNGDAAEKVPLKALISASNETPPANQGLEALYDRFLVRLFVPPMQERDNFETLMRSKPTEPTVEIDANIKIDSEEWVQWQKEIHSVKLSQEVITVINLIKNNLDKLNEKFEVYVSDRRWQRAATLIKTSAFLCGRKSTNLSDSLLLRHCLWTTADNRKKVIEIVEKAVGECGLATGIDNSKLDKEKEKLDQDIQVEFFYTEEFYETTKLGEDQFFKIQVPKLAEDYSNGIIYLPVENMKTTEEFHPVDRQANEITNLTCSFNEQGSCSIETSSHSHYRHTYIEELFTPKILFHKGDKRLDTHDLTRRAFSEKVLSIQEQYKTALKRAISLKNETEADLDIPFVPVHIRSIAYKSMAKQIEGLKLRIADCNRLYELIGNDQKLVKAS